MLEIEVVRILEGPNIYYPQPAVFARLRLSHDIRDQLSLSIKTWAQAVGIIIGYLRMNLHEEPDDWRLDVRFTCNHPAIGGEIIQQAVADLQAQERHDDEWNHDEALMLLHRRRMRESPPLPLLQLWAEAQGHGIAVIPVGDGTVQFGTGSRSWRCDPSQLSLGLSITPPWAEIGSVPLVAIGGIGADQLAQRVIEALQTKQRVAGVVNGTWQSITNALLDQNAEIIVVGLDHADVVEHGLAFNRCDVGVVLGISELVHEQALAAGLPALLTPTNGTLLLLESDAQTKALAERTPTPVSWLGTAEKLANPLAEIVNKVCK